MVRNARLQRQAVVTIGHTNGIAIYDWNWRNEKYVDGGQAWAPKWLVDLIGVDYFGHVAAVAFRSDAPVTDEVMALVGRLNKLEGLNVSQTKITDTASG